MENREKMSEAFDIKSASLKDGYNELYFEAGNDFFRELHGDDEISGFFKVNLQLEKQTAVLALDFEVEGAFYGNCDRCLEPVENRVNFHSDLIVKLTEEEGEDTDEIVYLPYDFEVFNVARVIYEMIKVRTPLKLVHEDISDCNSDMLDYLEDEDEEQDNIDPRWAELAKLKNNN